MQDLYYSLVDEKTDKHSFEEAMQLPSDNLMPQRNIPFRKTFVLKDRTSATGNGTEFVCRLRQQANICNFSATIDEHIRDKIIEKCNSGELRAKFLEKSTRKLLDFFAVARAYEAIRERLETMDRPMEPNFADNHEINVVHTRIDKTKLFCYACGKAGHFHNALQKEKKCIQ